MIMNMPVVENKSVLWNIDNKVYSELTYINDVDNIASTYSVCYLKDILYYDDKIYVAIAADKNAYLYMNGGSGWERLAQVTTNNYVDESASRINLLGFKGQIIISVNPYTASYVSGLYKYADEKVTALKTQGGSNGTRATCSVCKTEDGEKLYWLVQTVGTASGTKDTTYSFYPYKYDGTTLTSISHSVSAMASQHNYGAMVFDGKLYVLMYSGNTSNDYYRIFDISNDTFTYMTNISTNFFHSINSSYNKNGKVYCLGDAYYDIYEIATSVTTPNPLCTDILYMTPYDDNTLLVVPRFEATKIKKLKLYKIATSYATKGTKILSNNSFAISDNLQATDDGYIVTESGEVKIGIYE